MTHRFHFSVIALAVAFAVVLPGLAFGQAASTAAKAPAAKAPAAKAPAAKAPAVKAWTLGRTPDGQPDLQGYWTNTTYVALERPANVNKEFYSQEEYIESVKRSTTCNSSLW